MKTLRYLPIAIVLLYSTSTKANDFAQSDICYNQHKSTTTIAEDNIEEFGDYIFRITDSGPCLIRYTGNEKSPILPEDFCGEKYSIGSEAFAHAHDLVSIVIPKGVTSIETKAFYCKDELQFVKITNGVTRIGESAFWGCPSLISVEIPKSIVSIGDWAFYDCI